MRAVVDASVLISALLARDGTPARLLRAWHDGAFETIVSGRLLTEAARTASYPKIASRIAPELAARFVRTIRAAATIADDPVDPPRVRSRDPMDDYQVALASVTRSILVTGDIDLLSLADRIPVMSPRAFLDRPEREGRGSPH